MLWALAVLAFNVFWYGAYLSFPIFGEDAAALYSSLTETIRYAGPVTGSFPIKWLEGLGQPNVFVTVTFDPFSWLMFSGLDHADSFRISYALRATVCWLTTYALAGMLFRGSRGIAITSAFVSMLVSFTLMHPAGIPTFAGIFVATQAAVFPGLLWLYLQIMRQPGVIGWPDAWFALALVMFALAYPMGSVLGLCVLVAFGLGALIAAKGLARRTACLALVKLVLLVAAVLFMPALGMYRAWSRVGAVSARYVFENELTSYGRAYSAPLLWHGVPVALRVVVLLAISIVMVSRWSRPIRMIGLTLGIVIAGSQLATIARASGIAPHVLERLPRPFYLEYFLPVFYAVAAGYALHRCRRMLWFSRFAWPRKVPGLLVFSGAAWVLFGAGPSLALLGAVLAFSEFKRGRGRGRIGIRSLAGAIPVPLVAVIGLFAGAMATWIAWPDGVHPLFFGDLACRQRVVWCRDRAGRSMGADASSITDFLRSRLAIDGAFRGRADFLLAPASRLAEFPIRSVNAMTREEFETVRAWYARAYEEGRRLFAPAPFPAASSYFPGSYFRHPPEYFRYERRGELAKTMDSLARSGEVTLGVLPEEVVQEIVAWSAAHPSRASPIRFPSIWEREGEVTIMVQERNRNFLATGNGMLLRALPYQDIPVASSYEQALDYLYYLLWTRYVNGGLAVRRSINFTSLETVLSDRLALIGVRYVVARDAAVPRPPDLPRVLGWRGYSIYEIADPNTAGYDPTAVVFADSLAGELRAMRDETFDPRRVAVVAEPERRWLRDGQGLARLRESRIDIAGQSLWFRGRSGSGRSLAVLPFRFSHCWRPEWSGTAGRIIRVDVALIGVVFEDTADVRLTWSAGYGPGTRCLERDVRLVPAAIAAAQEIR